MCFSNIYCNLPQFIHEVGESEPWMLEDFANIFGARSLTRLTSTSNVETFELLSADLEVGKQLSMEEAFMLLRQEGKSTIFCLQINDYNYMLSRA